VFLPDPAGAGYSSAQDAPVGAGAPHAPPVPPAPSKGKCLHTIPSAKSSSPCT